MAASPFLEKDNSKYCQCKLRLIDEDLFSWHEVKRRGHDNSMTEENGKHLEKQISSLAMSLKFLFVIPAVLLVIDINIPKKFL